MNTQQSESESEEEDEDEEMNTTEIKKKYKFGDGIRHINKQIKLNKEKAKEKKIQKRLQKMEDMGHLSDTQLSSINVTQNDMFGGRPRQQYFYDDTDRDHGFSFIDKNKEGHSNLNMT